ncbi:unnamed protein product [Camellia sinensis]
MFTNGMTESISSKVLLQDVPLEAFKAMLEFMYYGELNKEDTMDIDTLLLQLLLLADQFGVTLLHQECCKTLLECLSEWMEFYWKKVIQQEFFYYAQVYWTRKQTLLDAVCPILQVISSVPPCKLIEETCEKKCSVHFDYCTTASIDFVLLDEATFSKILKHPDLTVTSEERVLNAILLWCITYLERSDLSRKIPTFDFLVKEAICYLEFGLANPQGDHNMTSTTKRCFKELQYICDGDSNGVLYFIGTSFGEHQWVNPVLAKRICVSASSPISRHTDPKVLVSRTYQDGHRGTSFAGPRIEDGKNCTWWIIDIGQELISSRFTKTRESITSL